jgi:hypothetical protein
MLGSEGGRTTSRIGVFQTTWVHFSPKRPVDRSSSGAAHAPRQTSFCGVWALLRISRTSVAAVTAAPSETGSLPRNRGYYCPACNGGFSSITASRALALPNFSQQRRSSRICRHPVSSIAHMQPSAQPCRSTSERLLLKGIKQMSFDISTSSEDC